MTILLTNVLHCQKETGKNNDIPTTRKELKMQQAHNSICRLYT